ncbi:hypothetical protein GEMRC1_001446 [Eukaryota sp. GEM-RC1]
MPDTFHYQSEIGKILGRAIDPSVRTGHLNIDLSLLFNSILLFAANVKIDQGCGDSLCHQNIASLQALAPRCFRPAILAEIKGHFLAIYGAVTVFKDGKYVKYVEHFITISLLYNRQNEFDIHLLANILVLVQRGIKDLKETYQSLISKEFESQPPSDLSITSFPVIGNDRLCYLGLVSAHSAVYWAEYRELQQKPIVVKFARSYDDVIHNRLFDEGLAPELFNCTEVSDQLFMIEMEYLEFKEFELLDCINLTAEKKQRVFNEVSDAVQFLNENNLVHGDLRSSNIFVSNKTFKIKIFDFDYSGSLDSKRLSPCLLINTLYSSVLVSL